MLLQMPEFLQRLIWLPIRFLYGLFLHFKIVGFENIRAVTAGKAGIIFASNHSWELDPTFIPAAFPFFSKLFPVFYVSLPASEYQHLPGIRHIAGGTFFKIWGAYPALIGRQSFEETLDNHIKLLEQGKNLCIFPEGMLRRAALYPPPKPGVSYLAWRTGATIVPVRLMHPGPFSGGRFFTGRLHMTIVFGKPLQFADLLPEKEEYTLEDHKVAAYRLMERIRDLTPHEV